MQHSPLALRRIFKVWWPLAASWLLMGMELPILSAFVARLAEPKINLAAYGGIVFPLALIIEAPVIMLLAASTALSKDWASYQKLRNYMLVSGGLLTALHLFTALTPFYYVVAVDILGAPPEIIEPARIGLIIMTPWTWTIAYRRLNQGVMIRFGHSNIIGVGTGVRLTMDISVLVVGYLLKLPGIVVATTAVAASVTAEAIYIGFRVQPVLRAELKPAPVIKPALTYRAFSAFYFPLVMTSLLTLLIQPLGSAALGRMPLALESLAVWPVVSGFIFMLRSMGVAFNEVVVALVDEPRSTRSLRRFTIILSSVTTAIIVLIAATPLSRLWLQDISALPPALFILARNGLWIGLLLPGLNALQSWYQGVLLNSGKTRGISEAVAIFLTVTGLVLWGGVAWGKMTGLYVGLIAFSAGMFFQTVWLWVRSRPIMYALCKRDACLES
ncbi:MAG: hypothetical protein HN855_14880 [Anaerolineae bacterium]|nr:hypothetical protein [Anaerolineae bacterium]MBT7070794.1 hypothetical protein [Anaerolineae bacterium]MBT7326439.1 hypothetical protein [Anaerolineae bacterium]